MNIFFIFDNGCLITPPLTGTILAGITRDSLIYIAREVGLTVTEERYSIDSWRADAKSGRLVEAFACGTAAVVTGIGKVTDPTGTFLIGDGMTGELTKKLKNKLVAIQRGIVPDVHGWIVKFDPTERHIC
jgi:branched-chain amino acid aminotransferase